jgi:Uma2 family endonuclease
MQPLTVDLSEIGPLDNKQLYRLCASNRELRIERTSKGELIAMSPSGSKSGARHAIILTALENWNARTKLGVVLDSSSGFLLKNGAMRAPDVAWVRNEVWRQFSDEQLEEFMPGCPDFVCEVVSPSDRLMMTQEKMDEWIANGCRLAWLIDPKHERTYIYQPGHEPDIRESFDTILSGGDVLPGFEFDLQSLKNI